MIWLMFSFGVIAGSIATSWFWIEDYVQLYGRDPLNLPTAKTRLSRLALRVIAAICALKGDEAGVHRSLHAMGVFRG